MPYLVSNNDRFALQIGENTLGGKGDDAVLLPGLVEKPPIAVITHWPGEEPSVRRVASAVGSVLVDDEPVSAAPRKLRHGTRIEVAGLRLVYGDLEIAQDTTAHVTTLPKAKIDPLAGVGHGAATADTGGRLIDLRTGRTIAVPGEGLVLGRDPECGVVLSGKDASRRHAVIRPSLYGYTLTDESANGVYVNGVRVQGQHHLGQGDVVRAAEAEFRFEGDPAAFEPSAELRASAHPASVPTPRPAAPSPSDEPGAPSLAEVAPQPAAAPSPGAGRVLATLEVVTRGVLAGTTFRIERPACTIGRSEQSDVHLQDRSVSGAHASLVLKGASWRISDLDSTNGTYVDGVRITGERLLPAECTVRTGDIKMTFRSLVNAADADGSTRRVVGTARR